MILFKSLLGGNILNIRLTAAIEVPIHTCMLGMYAHAVVLPLDNISHVHTYICSLKCIYT